MRLIDIEPFETGDGVTDCSIYQWSHGDGYTNITTTNTKNIPTIEEEPVKHGFDTGACRMFCCSECGYGVNDIFVDDEIRHLPDIGPVFRYCPNCGAKMLEVTE